jgi:hypothetical protein
MRVFREEVLVTESMAAEVAAGVESPQIDQRRAEND